LRHHDDIESQEANWNSFIDSVGLRVTEIATLAGFAAAGFVIAAVITFIARRLANSKTPGVASAIVNRCSKALHLLLPLIGVAIALPSIDTADGLATYLPRLVTVLTIAMTGMLAIGVVRGFIDHIVATHSMQQADNLEARRIQTQFRVLGRIVIFVIIVATVAGMLVSIPSIRNIGVSIFASAGIAGLAIGLAARPALSNLIAGVQIAFTQPIRLEDAVVVEGEWGWIEEITMTFVVVRIWDLRRLVLPISYFIEKPFQNWTRTKADILGSVILHMDYAVPLDEVRSEFGRALRDLDTWDGKVEVVHVTDCSERTMEIRLLMSARNSPDAWELRCAVRERLISYLQQNYPQSLPRLRLAGDVEMTGSPDAT
jgi:small-conductance mechanosensitive channel